MTNWLDELDRLHTDWENNPHGYRIADAFRHQTLFQEHMRELINAAKANADGHKSCECGMSWFCAGYSECPRCENQKLRDLLGRVEWGGYQVRGYCDDGGDACPLCGNYESESHALDCELANVLRP